MHTLNLIAGNLAFILNALSFWMADVVRLRLVAIAASVCFIIYSMTVASGPLWLMVGWSFVFLSINLYRVIWTDRIARREKRTRGSNTKLANA